MRAAMCILLLALAMVGAPVWADERDAAIAGQGADVATTAVGLAMGAAEANPLGILTLGAKAVVAAQIEAAPAEEQPGLWRAFGAFGWGATANNLCVIAAIASGGIAAGVCPLLGLVTGLSVYGSDAP